jgi:hypothetical protein
MIRNDLENKVELVGEVNDWSIDIEEILDKIRLNSTTMCEFHKGNYYNAKGRLKFFKLPTIILSGITSVFSVGLQPYLEQGIISVITCLIGLIIGIINSIELFLAIQNTMESELKISKDFYLLSIDIFKVLMLNRTNRVDKGRIYLEEKYNMYCKLVENSVLVNRSIVDKLVPIEDMIIKRNTIKKEIRSSSPINNLLSGIKNRISNLTPNSKGNDDNKILEMINSESEGDSIIKTIVIDTQVKNTITENKDEYV